MKKKLKKRMAKRQAEMRILERMEMDMNGCIFGINNSIIRITNLLQDQTRTLSKFPMTVRDFATDPPYHAGEYIVWFVKTDQETESRKYTFVGGKWYGNQGEEIDIRKYKPSMWMLLPTFDPGVIEIYKRRQE